MLEENKQYNTITGKQVIIRTAINRDRMIMYYGAEILKILGKNDLPRRERSKELEKQEVVLGTTDDVNMQSGYRHKQSGKCLWGNLNGKTENLKAFLKKFDIEDQG